MKLSLKQQAAITTGKIVLAFIALCVFIWAMVKYLPPEITLALCVASLIVAPIHGIYNALLADIKTRVAASTPDDHD